MEFYQSKFFVDIDSNTLFYFPVPKNKDYYSFIKDKIQEGFRQVIITSDIMIEYLVFAFSKRKASLVEVELLEDDPDYQNEINNDISAVNGNRDLFVNLVEELKYLSDEKTAEIKLIKIKYRENSKPVVLSISINGLITHSSNEESIKGINDLKKIISESLL